MRKTLLTLAAAALISAPTVAIAKVDTRAMLSKKCDAEKLKQLSGGAITAIKPGPGQDIYTVSLDTAKMTWAALTQKMVKAGCF